MDGSPFYVTTTTVGQQCPSCDRAVSNLISGMLAIWATHNLVVVSFALGSLGKSTATKLGKLLLLVVAVTVSACVVGPLTLEGQIQQYSGDGVIHSRSTLLMAGYIIEFPKFEASRPYAASYRLSHVPQLQRVDGRSNPGIYLRFKSNLGFAATRELKKKSGAVLRLTIVDSHGEVVRSMKSAVSVAGWTQRQNVYSISGGEFRFDAGASYVLKIHYIPGPVPLPAKELYVVIDDCAFY
jgi:hypothetical protein